MCFHRENKNFRFLTIAVCVDDLNIVQNQTKLQKNQIIKKGKLEMKYIGQTKFCLGLQNEHTQKSIKTF